MNSLFDGWLARRSERVSQQSKVDIPKVSKDECSPKRELNQIIVTLGHSNKRCLIVYLDPHIKQSGETDGILL